MRKLLTLLTAVLLVFSGCITVNVPLGGGDLPPSFQWRLRWDAPEHSGVRVSDSSIRVKDFDASANYQLSGMVINHLDGTVSTSSTNRWVVRPGAMLSEMLSRDLQASGNYPAIFRTVVSVPNVVTVEGYVREFGATQADSAHWVAVLDVDVSVMEDRGTEVLFQKNYRFEKDMPESGFASMAEQLSELGALWSQSICSDLAEALLPRR